MNTRIPRSSKSQDLTFLFTVSPPTSVVGRPAFTSCVFQK
jgi:hypothetical protein